MTQEQTILSPEKKQELEAELVTLEKEQVPALATRIDEARQMGDLSENAEYHQAREDLSWTKARIAQIKEILETATILKGPQQSDVIAVGSTVTVVVNDKERTFTVVGAQEADPAGGKISNESPIGEALLGKSKGDAVEVETPAGTQTYTIKNISI